MYRYTRVTFPPKLKELPKYDSDDYFVLLKDNNC